MQQNALSVDMIVAHRTESDADVFAINVKNVGDGENNFAERLTQIVGGANRDIESRVLKPNVALAIDAVAVGYLVHNAAHDLRVLFVDLRKILLVAVRHPFCEGEPYVGAWRKAAIAVKVDRNPPRSRAAGDDDVELALHLFASVHDRCNLSGRCSGISRTFEHTIINNFTIVKI